MERVGKKSFIITTLLMPLFMVLMMVAPALIMMFSTPGDKKVAVIDPSGVVYNELKTRAKDIDYLQIERVSIPLDSALADKDYDGVLNVNADVVDHPEKAAFYLRDAGSVEMEAVFNSSLKESVEQERLKRYNIENLSQILDEVNVTSTLPTLRIDEKGEEERVSSMTSFILGMVMTFILYMFILMYGQMVMTSIIEEKNNRVLELVVSSVKPLQLMLGKIFGVGLVAVVQIAIWGLLICVTSAFIMPMLLPESLSQQVEMFNAGTFNPAASSADPDMIRAIAMFSSVGYIAKMFVYLTLFLIGGFLFYASIFAAIGSAVDNVQDASQLQTFATLPIILALLVAMSAGKDPNTTLAVCLSYVPFTSPMVMLSRIPFDIPSWQVWTSLAILYVSFVLMAWVAAKIYRIGIFMYGKKPTIKDLARWARYK